jgi:hypothetical protein
MRFKRKIRGDKGPWGAFDKHNKNQRLGKKFFNMARVV